MPPPIVFTASPLDRAGHRRRDRAWLAGRLAGEGSRFLPLWRLKPLIEPGAAPAIAWQPYARVASFVRARRTVVMLGTADGVCHFAVDADGPEDPAAAGPLAGAGRFIDVRTIAPQLEPGQAGILAQARSLIDWHARHRFCARCGRPTAVGEGGYVRRCLADACAAEHFPRTDPVVIMLVERGDRCLLGRQPHFPAGVYSALAGFVEPGESIEEAVRREIAEEAGIRCGEVRYVASQPWPFPSSLMIGCVARAGSDAIRVDGAELDDARWFSRAEIGRMVERSLGTDGPRLPPPLSLAHQLARRWLGLD